MTAQERPDALGQLAESTLRAEQSGAAGLTAPDFLVSKGFARETAENLLEELGGPKENEVLCSWAERICSEFQKVDNHRATILHEHHVNGIPPFEPPPRLTEEEAEAASGE